MSGLRNRSPRAQAASWPVGSWLALSLAAAAGALSVVVGASACAPDEKLAPVTTAAPADAGPADAPTDTAPPVTPIRQVMVRNPLGVPAVNLLADGDFELSVVSNGQAASGQYGWVAFAADGSRTGFISETGGLCRTGLRCAHMKKDQALFGRGTSAPDKGAIDASIWVKPLDVTADTPTNKVCKSLVKAYVLRCDDGVIRSTLKTASEPAADGWCDVTIEGASGDDLALCMYLELEKEALVDSATLLPSAQKNDLASIPVVSSEERDRVTRVTTLLKNQMRFDRGGPAEEPGPPY